MTLEELLEETRRNYNELDDLYEERKILNQEIESAQEEVRTGVVTALQIIQEELGEDERYVLMESTEMGRGGRFEFEEVLTPRGIEAQNVTCSGETGYSGESMYLWPGSWDSYEEPLEVETEYLVGERDSPAFIRKLYRRMVEDEIPESSFTYD
jgi:hypothetical protein